MSAQDYSTTPSSNTGIDGVDVAENCAFAGLNNAIRSLMADFAQYADDVGGAAVSTGTDTIALTTAQTITAYADGLHLVFIAGGTNTGAATLNVDSVGAKAIVKGDGSATALAAGDITAGMPVIVVYDASVGSGSFLLVNPLSGLATPTVYLSDIVEDTTPTLGGALDAGGFDINNGGVIFLTEQADAEDDVEGKGQIWVDTATPNLLKFTDDAGTDHSLIAGKQIIYIPAGAMTAAVTSGAASGSIEETTNAHNYATLDFDASSDEYACFEIAMPENWDEGTLTFKVVWSSTAADTDGVSWGLQAVAVADGDDSDVAYGTGVVVDDANQSNAGDVLITAESGAVTVAGSPAAGELTQFRIYRDVSQANDTATEDAQLRGVYIYYTIDTPMVA